jgi:hypothetical protein
MSNENETMNNVKEKAKEFSEKAKEAGKVKRTIPTWGVIAISIASAVIGGLIGNKMSDR